MQNTYNIGPLFFTLAEAERIADWAYSWVKGDEDGMEEPDCAEGYLTLATISHKLGATDNAEWILEVMQDGLKTLAECDPDYYLTEAVPWWWSADKTPRRPDPPSPEMRPYLLAAGFRLPEQGTLF